ncbi:MAG: PorV/PorQ family protein [Candidatus Krumholzibacteria bacterium]|nr:PorV/PorQ family protein [Candidatus Krumholzibacteria bacterium]
MIRRISIAVLVAAGVALPFAGLLAGEPGTSGFLFLRLGNGARAGAMGEAFTAVADDATSIYYNPAGMASADGVDLNVTHSEWLMDVRFEQVSVVNEMLGGAVGLSFTGVYYGAMDRYPDSPPLGPDGSFSPYDLACAAGYAMDVLPNLSAGVTAKLLYEKIDFESATGWAVDVGLTHRSMIEGLTLAASMLNLGPMAKFVEEKFYPPFQLRGGAAYRYDADWLKGNVILASDAVFPNDGTTKLHLGMEYNYRMLASVRVGYKSNYQIQGPTFGFGVAYRNLRFDYAFMPIESVFGDIHRFSINVFSPGR